MSASNPERKTKTVKVQVQLSAYVEVEVEVRKENDDWIQAQVDKRIEEDSNWADFHYINDLKLEDYEVDDYD